MSGYKQLENRLWLQNSVEEAPRCRRPAWTVCCCLVATGLVLVFCELVFGVSEQDQSEAVNLGTIQGNVGSRFPFISLQTQLPSLGFRLPFRRSSSQQVTRASKTPVGGAPEWKDALGKVPFKVPQWITPFVEEVFKGKEEGLKGEPLEACSPSGRDGYCKHDEEVQQVCVVVKEGGFSVGCIDAWDYASSVMRDPEKAEGLELMCGATNIKLRKMYKNELALSGKQEAVAALTKVEQVCGLPPGEEELVRDKKTGKFFRKGEKFPISNPFDDPEGYW